MKQAKEGVVGHGPETAGATHSAKEGHHPGQEPLGGFWPAQGCLTGMGRTSKRQL